MNWLSPKLWGFIGAAAVVGALLWFHWHQVREADDRGYNRRVAEEQIAQLAAERRAREEDDRALQNRAKELADIRAIYAARDPSVIRVCIPTPSLPRTAEADGSIGAAAPATGVLSEEGPRDIVTYFDPQPLDELHYEADTVVADCRAYVERQKATHKGTD